MSTIRVDGLRELGEAMRKLSSDVANRAARAATGAAASIVKKAAVQNVVRSPAVDTGSLRDAIIAKRLSKADAGDLTSAHIVTVRRRLTAKQKKGGKAQSAPHARFVEFGTVNMPAEPFLRPALDQNKQAAIDAMKSRLEARLRKAGAL